MPKKNGEPPTFGRFNGEYDDNNWILWYPTFRHMWQDIWSGISSTWWWSTKMICKQICYALWVEVENPAFLMKSDLFISTYLKLLRFLTATRAVIDVGQSHPQRGPHLRIMSRSSLWPMGYPLPSIPMIQSGSLSYSAYQNDHENEGYITRWCLKYA